MCFLLESVMYVLHPAEKCCKILEYIWPRLGWPWVDNDCCNARNRWWKFSAHDQVHVSRFFTQAWHWMRMPFKAWYSKHSMRLTAYYALCSICIPWETLNRTAVNALKKHSNAISSSNYHSHWLGSMLGIFCADTQFLLVAFISLLCL